MEKHRLRRAVPNEKWQMVLEFDGGEYRIFDTSILYKQKGWEEISYPRYLKRYTVTPESICWPDQGTLDVDYLYQHSNPIDRGGLERQILLLGAENRAPTLEHPQYHEYAVYLAPFSDTAFRVDENIGGGFAGREEGRELSIQSLLMWPRWKWHFQMSGCEWAVPIVELLATDPQSLIDTLVKEACERLWLKCQVPPDHKRV